MTRPRQSRTCNHLIYAQALTGVHQAVRYFVLVMITLNQRIIIIVEWLDAYTVVQVKLHQRGKVCFHLID